MRRRRVKGRGNSVFESLWREREREREIHILEAFFLVVFEER